MIRILTYNIECGRRLDDIYAWIGKNKKQIDVICFQEFPETELQHLSSHFPSPSSTFSFTPGMIKYKKQYGQLTVSLNKDLKLREAISIDLGVDHLEKWYRKRPTQRTALLTNFSYKGVHFSVVNIHLSAFSLNAKRRDQLKKVLDNISEDKAVILGDYNYSSLILRSKLIDFMAQSNFTEAGEKMITHQLQVKVRQQLDYVFYRNMEFESIEVEGVDFSDHLPIFSEFSVR